nr:MAG TPA: hypothetical protein [Caudoviricetes sp.]
MRNTIVKKYWFVGYLLDMSKFWNSQKPEINRV